MQRESHCTPGLSCPRAFSAGRAPLGKNTHVRHNRADRGQQRCLFTFVYSFTSLHLYSTLFINVPGCCVHLMWFTFKSMFTLLLFKTMVEFKLTCICMQLGLVYTLIKSLRYILIQIFLRYLPCCMLLIQGNHAMVSLPRSIGMTRWWHIFSLVWTWTHTVQYIIMLW